MEKWINLAGKYGLSGLFIIIGYFYYDKNQGVSFIISMFGIILAFIIIISDITYKYKELYYESRGVVRR